jgi:GT2 family glycosyltransferase/glycosyltransferase involved in cell wall biosynthesis
MRILVVAHGFPPLAQGGSEIYAHAHTRALKALGDEVVVLTREQNPTRPEYAVRDEMRDGVRIVWVNNTFRSARSFEETYCNRAIGAVADRLIDEVGPDVAHIHHLTCLSTTIVRSLADRCIPCIFTLHDYWLMCHRGQLLDVDYQLCDGPGTLGCHACLGPVAGMGAIGFAGAAVVRAIDGRLPAVASPVRRVAGVLSGAVKVAGLAEDRARARVEHMRHACDLVTHFLAPSRHLRDRFVAFGIPPERITHAAYGFDHGPFRGIERTRAPRLRLGFLGSLMISKAPHVLLEAFRRLPRGLASVDLFGAVAAYHGDDTYRARLEPLLRQEGVTVHGAIDHADVARALSSIDVLVVPSIWPENNPLVIQEAFLAGAPVVASRIGGISESVDDGRNGLLFRAGEASDLARILERLLGERGLLDTLRGGISPVRGIDEDVRFARGLYEASVSRRNRRVPPGATATRRTAAVVLNYRTRDDTFLAVRSLIASRQGLDHVIVVNNDAEDDRGLALGSCGPRVTVLHTGSNLGFSGGMNAGIREALARGVDRVLLVNSDVIVPPDCLTELERAIDATPGAGIAGPVVLSRSCPDQVASLGISYAPATGRMRHRGARARFAALDLSAQTLVDGVAGCVMLVTRDVFSTMGLLDEDFFFAFEDLDFCLRARRAGYVTVTAGSAVVYHEGGRSIGATSPSRLYFAARNHLLLARRTGSPSGRLAVVGRTLYVIALNLAHAVRADGGSMSARLRAVARGTRDYFAGRLGAGSEAGRLIARPDVARLG